MRERGLVTKAVERDFSRGRQLRYAQIASALRVEVDAGKWAVGGALPSIQKLAEIFGVAPETVRQALLVLEGEGIVRRRQGVGTMIETRPRDLRWLKLPVSWDDLLVFLGGLEVQRTLIETSEKTPLLEPHEGRPAASYTYFKRLHSRAGEPFCILSIYLDAEIYIREPVRFREELVVPLLAGMIDVEIGKVVQTLRFDVADREVAQLLSAPIVTPIVWLRRSIKDRDGNNIYLAEIAYRGDVVALELDLSPPG